MGMSELIGAETPRVEGPARDPASGPSGGRPDEARLLAALRAGDEEAFAELVDRHHSALVRLARNYVPTQALAEEVAQDTWLAVIQGLDRFEGRSSLKTWIFRILVFRAQSRGVRERRTTPLSGLQDDGNEGPALPPERFQGSDALWAGHWAAPPRRWDGDSEGRLLAAETRTRLREAIARLPPAQRDVIVLRDINGLNAAEVCEILGVTEGNQRVLLHRARSKVRSVLEQYLDDE